MPVLRPKYCLPLERPARRRHRPRTRPPELAPGVAELVRDEPSGPLDDAARAQRRFLGTRTEHALVRYEPFYEVGGDIFDTVTVDGRRVTIVGDVAGKGVAAALVTAGVTAVFRGLVRAGLSPSEILESLNEAQGDLGRDELFVTAVVISIDPQRGVAQVANAGHLPPWLLRARHLERIGCSSGTPLGMVPGETFPLETIALVGDEVAVLMTDGVTDTFAEPDDPCGDRLLGSLLATAPRDAQRVHSMLSAALDRMKNGSYLDDLTLVTLQLAS